MVSIIDKLKALDNVNINNLEFIRIFRFLLNKMFDFFETIAMKNGTV